MRACHLIHALEAGGAEEVLVELATAADGAGIELTVVALTGTADSLHARRLRELGIPVCALGASRWDPGVLRRARRLVAASRPDVLHSHMKHADLAAAYLARSLRLPWVSTLHVIEDGGGPVEGAKRWLAGQARCRLADRTIAVSDAQRAWYLRTFPARPDTVLTVYNGVRDPGLPTGEGRAALRAELGLAEDEVVAANVAIMRGGKGHEDLLAALARLPERECPRVLLLGDGPERPRLEDLARGLGLGSQQVQFLGYRNDVPRVLQAVDLLVHPSHADALPTAVIKAMAAGLPVVASDVGGIPEILGGEAGVLVPAGSVETLAGVLAELVRDDRARARLGAAGRRRFEETFEVGVWAHRLRGVYSEVTGAAPERAPSSP